jgi:hypothetical protein
LTRTLVLSCFLLRKNVPAVTKANIKKTRVDGNSGIVGVGVGFVEVCGDEVEEGEGEPETVQALVSLNIQTIRLVAGGLE